MKKSDSTTCSSFKVGDVVELIENPKHEFRAEFFRGLAFDVTHVDDSYIRLRVLMADKGSADVDYDFEWIVRSECWSDFKIRNTEYINASNVSFEELFAD